MMLIGAGRVRGIPRRWKKPLPSQILEPPCPACLAPIALLISQSSYPIEIRQGNKNL
jgi:hypothetical protein